MSVSSDLSLVQAHRAMALVPCSPVEHKKNNHPKGWLTDVGGNYATRRERSERNSETANSFVQVERQQ